MREHSGAKAAARKADYPGLFGTFAQSRFLEPTSRVVIATGWLWGMAWGEGK